MLTRIALPALIALTLAAPVAGAATQRHHEAPAPAHNDSIKCGNTADSLSADQCLASGAAIRRTNAVGSTVVSSTEIGRGTGGSGDTAWQPKAHRMALNMKPATQLDKGSNSSPSQL